MTPEILERFRGATSVRPGPELQKHCQDMKFGKRAEAIMQKVVVFDDIKSLFEQFNDEIRAAGGIKGVIIDCTEVYLITLNYGVT